VRRLFSTRHGFFALAALVCWSLLLVIEQEHRWVPLVIGSIYALLSFVFALDERGRARPRRQDPSTSDTPAR
jgi:hypothetical protein